ncbi:MAG: hypothetical protein ACOCWQ_04020 [Nanoarchaeota archaeon]
MQRTSRRYVQPDHKNYDDILSDAASAVPDILRTYDRNCAGFLAYFNWRIRNVIVDGIRSREGRG